MTEQVWRVSYVNSLDGNRRVLIGRLTREKAELVAEKWGSPASPMFQLQGVRIDACDGTPDGDIIKESHMTEKDTQEFIDYMKACTDAQVIGVYEKEREAGRAEYMLLARAEAERRNIWEARGQ